MVVFGFCLMTLALGVWRTTFELYPAAQSFNKPVIDRLEVIERAFPSPQAELLSGILFGSQQNLDYEWKNKMNLAGVRHVTAVSGANIILLAQVLVWLGVALGLYRQWAALSAAFLIWGYIFMIGWPPSAVRAGIMASLLLIAGALGRPNRTQRAVVLAGAIMLAFNPRLLLFDAGFQLSFLATFGLIYLAPLLRDWLASKRGFLQTGNLAEFLAINFSAWIFTLPLSVYYFGYFSPMSIAANLFITPVVPLIMISGFLLLIVGSIWQPLAIAFAWPLNLPLNYFLQITDWFSPAALAYWQFYFSGSILAVCYFGLIFWTWRWQKSRPFI
ncbi:MAG: ComEC/Rec2 family competence protein [Candidatus Pacebacteria bacterium]|nr:ComEC/Rec2 family competence protein [Candidatus Paceibacterota bacterium]